MDYSKHRITERTLELLFRPDAAQSERLASARARGQRRSMSAKNARSAAIRLRGQAGDDFQVDGQPVMAQVLAVRARMAALPSRCARASGWADGQPIALWLSGHWRLGPRALVGLSRALPLCAAQLDMRFVANLDGQHRRRRWKGWSQRHLVVSPQIVHHARNADERRSGAQLLATPRQPSNSTALWRFPARPERVRASSIDPANMFGAGIGGQPFIPVWSTIGLAR